MGRDSLFFSVAAGVGLAIAMLNGFDPTLLSHGVAVLAAGLCLMLLSLSVHEAAHALAAAAFGDRAALDDGRLTLNPVMHFDLVGMVFVPLALAVVGTPFSFGWAKPVVVDYTKLHPYRLGMFVVSAAGPIANLAFAAALATLLRRFGVDGHASIIASAAWLLVATNIAIGLFNLLPIFPMDGGRMIAAFLPRKALDWLIARQGYASLAMVAFLVLVPPCAMEAGVALPSISRVFEYTVDIATGDPSGAWAVPALGWIRARPQA